MIDPMRVLASCVRGMLIPAPGHDIMAIDLAGIESRLTAWVFDEAWKLKAFRAKDNGTGPDTYKLAYSKAFKIGVDDVTKFQRQIGKVMELALGFEGGVGAFITMAPNYGVDLDQLAEIAYPNIAPDILDGAYEMWDWAVKNKRTHDLDQKPFVVIQSLVKMWRNDHPAHVVGWKEMKDASIAAVENPGVTYKIKSGLIMFKLIPHKGRNWLYMRLPSGRRIAYFEPEVREGPRGKILSYMGVDTATRRWMRVDTYGGRLTQNFAEGIARDLLVNGMQKLEAIGARVIGSVHDEAISEPKTGHGSLEAAREEFLKAPSWAAGLPLNAEGFRAARYRK